MLRVEAGWFKDETGRTIMLRGVNLGGSSKVPLVPNGATHLREGFFNHREVSFVGRPFPLEDAADHFARLRRWGFNCLRFVITWEAIEHEGPSIYDEAYLHYLRRVVKLAGEYGLYVIIDPHQDMWSRFSGGDGAPGWTLEMAGFQLETLHETGAAFLHQQHDGPLPAMIWPSNAGKLAAATMFTLFFAGDDFAPKTLVHGESIQSYLQRHYFASMRLVAARLSDMAHVLGYGAMNEPLTGYIGTADLTQPLGVLQMGAAPTPWQGMLLGDGLPQQVDLWRPGGIRFRKVGKALLNSEGLRAWQEGHPCPWQANGVWAYTADGTPTLLRPDYFAATAGRVVDFNRDYYEPFLERFAAAVREEHPGSLLFVEPALQAAAPVQMPADEAGVVYAPHWYDVLTLFLKRYSSLVAVDAEQGRAVFTPWLIRRSFAAQLQRLKAHALSHMGEAPTLIGETGVPFDLNGGKAFATGDFRVQTKVLQRTIAALEQNLLSYVLWNYTADNEDAHGDQWNGENLSIYGLDQAEQGEEGYRGGRALEAVIRPFALAVAGEPLAMHFDPASRRFELRFRHDPRAAAPTLIFVPRFHYRDGYAVDISDGRVVRDEPAQSLIYHHDADTSEHRLVITPARAV